MSLKSLQILLEWKKSSSVRVAPQRGEKEGEEEMLAGLLPDKHGAVRVDVHPKALHGGAVDLRGAVLLGADLPHELLGGRVDARR